MKKPQLSVIVPVLNEPQLCGFLRSLQPLRDADAELILVDGGSDQLPAACAELVDKLLLSSAGRARQMNAGAMAAAGEYILFLHADTQLPPDFIANFNAVLSPSVRWGFNRVALDHSAWRFRVISAAINWRSRLTKVSTGDQCQFFKREFFWELGGFASIPLMEDVDISKRARAQAAPLILLEPVKTSARRWLASGTVKTVLLMWSLRLAYWVGVPPSRLASIYYPHRSASSVSCEY